MIDTSKLTQYALVGAGIGVLGYAVLTGNMSDPKPDTGLSFNVYFANDFSIDVLGLGKHLFQCTFVNNRSPALQQSCDFLYNAPQAAILGAVGGVIKYVYDLGQNALNPQRNPAG